MSTSYKYPVEIVVLIFCKHYMCGYLIKFISSGCWQSGLNNIFINSVNMRDGKQVWIVDKCFCEIR
jgi:hypothetical protein